ncbi:MAG: adenylate/guanylate cyclase domain-containing protein, partial [Rhodopila sp.]
LPILTADDLRDIGVTSVGHRRRILDAIAPLRLVRIPDPTLVEVSSDPGMSRAPSGPTASGPVAERRPLSVMFCDLIGFTALSARLDPEDLREVIHAYQARVVSTIRTCDGFIARHVGDGVLIYFGWPQAHETDAARAVRAALAVAAAINEAPVAGQALQVRIGIATGLVVIGELIGLGDTRQQTAVGETPNRAARLQSLAGPGQVVIDAATRRQIGGLFTCQDLGAIALKGLSAPVPAWQVLAENRTLGQFEALRSNQTPLVGRQEELELLLCRWTQARSGSGNVVLISAEPGVGKSRLAEALAERIAADPHIRQRYFCSPHHQDSALYPMIAQMERTAGFAHGDVPTARLARLQALLAAEFQPPWVGQPQVTMMNLSRLERQDAAAMVTSVAGRAVLSSDIVAEITKRTDGVPLFIEELTKAVLEAGAQVPATLSAAPRPGLPMPPTLHASLMARLDRLGVVAREVAQAGAVVGREFGYLLLASIVDLPEPQLQEALDRLTHAGLLFVRGSTPQASYLFKHVLVQDAAYGSLLRSRRQSLHRRVAITLEEQFPEIVITQPALLAQHCMLAELVEPAVRHLLAAARHAFRASAYPEAISHLKTGLELLERLPEGSVRTRFKMDLKSSLSLVRDASRGYGHMFQPSFSTWHWRPSWVSPVSANRPH